MYARAKAPSRGTSSQTIQWGLLSIPIQVFTGQESGSAVPRKMFTLDGNPVGSKSYDKVTGEDVDSSQIIKKATASDGTLVELSDEEIESAVTGGPHKGVAEIICRIPLESLGREYVIDKVDQVRAAKTQQGTKKVDNPPAQRALALLLDGLGATGTAAVVRVATKSGAKYAAITPDGFFLTIAFAESVREAAPLPEMTFSDQERDLAIQLLNTIEVATPEFTDTCGAQVQSFVDQKAQGITPEAPVEVEAAPVIDLMAALAASIKAAA
jgi:DNA end-binding protein Ku